MAVDNCSDKSLMEDIGDDTQLVFKRSCTSSRQSQSNFKSNKLSSQKPDGKTGRRAFDVTYCGSTSGSNGKKVIYVKASSVKSNLTGSKASTSSSKVPPSRFPGGNPKMASAMTDHGGNLARGDSDSDDDLPLSTRVKRRFDNYTKVPQSSNLASMLDGPMQEDSDDEKPLSSKLKRVTTGASSRKCSDSVDGNPLARNMQQTGLARNMNKRPYSKISIQSSIKKPKLSDASTLNNCRRAPAKAEPKIKERNDRILISDSSATKSSVDKKVDECVVSPVKNSSRRKHWDSLVHNGVIFPPSYQPHGVEILYKKKPVYLTPEQEEVATMYAAMLDSDYMNNDVFKYNFFDDWKEILGKDHVIQNLEDCDFTPIYEWHQAKKEKMKHMSSEEKKAIKEEKMKQEEKYMWAIVDNVKEKVGNFRVEPPGIFVGRGGHPKIGRLKKRILPSDVTINIGKGAPIPECPVAGERWNEIRHDNTVTWLAFWKDPIDLKGFKYVFLAASSTLKGQSDMEKYQKARKLTDHIDKIRETYTKNLTSKDVTKCQIAVATYLIDKLALRAGNEKDDDEADTVGCCTLKVENVEPVPPNTLKFDFLGKDSIRYQNVVEVDLPAFEAIQKFRKGKRGGDDLFDMLDTSKLNAHLKELMPGLTAKVFRTYNASRTLDDLLTAQTNGEDVAENIVIYQRANKEVAIICNHKRTVSKSYGQQIERLDEKINKLNNVLEELKVDFDRAKKGKPPLKGVDGKTKRNLAPEAIEKKLAQTYARIEKMEWGKTTKEDMKTVALGTSKINYLDPRITVAWCKRHELPIEKIYNKSLLAKFSWAMDVHPSFRFSNVLAANAIPCQDQGLLS